MTTYHLSIRSYDGFESSSFRNIQLQDEQDFNRAQQLCENKKNMVGPWKWSFIPIRTDQLSDLLLPSTIHGALRMHESVQGYSENLLAVVMLISVIWDLVTLPIRLITYLPRFCCNKYAENTEHPLVPYLRENGLADVVDVDPEVEYQFGNRGEADVHIYRKKPQRVNIHLYTENVVDGGQSAERRVDLYGLYLAEEEVPFMPTHQSSAQIEALAPGARVVPEDFTINIGRFQIPVFSPGD